MAARIVHHAAAERLLKCVEFKNPDRFRLGVIIPDSAGWSSEESKKAHFLKLICGGTKKTYDLTAFRSRFGRKVMTDDLYLGYYLHLVQDLLFRGFICGKYNWDPHTDGNIDRLHDDYRKANTYLSKRHGLTFNIVLPENLNAEELSHIAEFKPREFLAEMYSDYKQNSGDLTKASPAFFFTGEMADEFIEIAVDGCLNELNALQKGVSAINETLLAFAW